MELRQLTLRPMPRPLKGFFRLPIEVRNQVYRYCLLELPKWEKRHDAFCRFTPRDCEKLERPPFILSQSSIDSPVCGCATRKGLSLLAVNRQIHHEAARVFWTGNAFCWDRYSSFAKDVIENLREEYRCLLQHVSIMTDAYETEIGSVRSTSANTVSRYYEGFWNAVLKCTGLRTLEVRPEYATCHHDFLNKLKSQLPKLESLSFLRLIVYDVSPGHEWNHWTFYDEKLLLWIKVSRKVDLSRILGENDCKEATRDFDTNFIVHARYAIETYLLGRPADQFGVPPGRASRYPYILPSLDDTSGPQRVKLRDRSMCDAHIYGLPISKATRLRHAKERIFTNVMLKKAGKLTPEEEKFKEVVKFARIRRKQMYKDHKADDTQWRAERRKTRAKEERSEEKKEKANEREQFEQMVREAKELRLAERKRGGGKAKSPQPSLGDA